MKIEILIIILFVHWIADFVLQSDKQAKGKATNIKELFNHVWAYSLVWLIVGIYYALYLGDDYTDWAVTAFYVITFFTHFVTDFVTSKWVKHYFDQNKYHEGFVVIGLDQFLHVTQLILTYKLLFI